MDAALAFIAHWNETHPLTLNRHTNQCLDQAAVVRALEEQPLEVLYEVCDWLKESGQIARYPRPAQWFRLTATGTRIFDQLRLEMQGGVRRRETTAERLSRLRRERLERKGNP